MNRLRQLIHEIHRRSLWQVLRTYVGASWAVLHVVDTVAGALQLSDWLEPVALVLLIVGLPIVPTTTEFPASIAEQPPFQTLMEEAGIIR